MTSLKGLTDAFPALRSARAWQALVQTETQAKIDALQRLEAQTNTCTGLQAQLDGETTLRAALEVEVGVLRRAALDLQGQVDALRRSLDTLQSQHSHAVDAVRKATGQLEAERHSRIAAESRLAESESRHTQAVRDLQRALGELAAHRQPQPPSPEISMAESPVVEMGGTPVSSSRPSRALLSHEEAYDFATVSCEAAPNAVAEVQWVVRDLIVHRRRYAEFRFRTRIDDGVAVMLLSRPNRQRPEPLQRWPGPAADDTELKVHPMLSADEPGMHRLALLQQLSASDWNLIRVMPRLLADVLHEGAVIVPAPHDGRTLERALRTSQQALARMAPVLRFDEVELFGQQNLDTRAVLGFRLHHMQMPGRRMDSFAFQLQSAVQEGALAEPVFLIFGEETSSAPFETWAPNARNGSDQPMMGVEWTQQGPSARAWAPLGQPDRTFVWALFQLLPLLMGTLRADGVGTHHGWGAWTQLVTDMAAGSLPAPRSVPLASSAEVL